MDLQPFDIVIDVSDNNPDINWKAVWDDGIRIAFCKVMQDAGADYPSGPEQLAAAWEAGIVPIAYAFLPGNIADPLAYAQEFAARAMLEPGMRFMLDWEGRASQACPAAVAEAVGLALTKIAGDNPIGYWGLPGATPAQPTAEMERWYRCVPRYPRPASRWVALPSLVIANPLHTWGEYGLLPKFAQYTSTGHVAGIPGAVDRSVIFAASLNDAIAWARGAAGAQDAPEAVPAPDVATVPVSPPPGPPLAPAVDLVEEQRNIQRALTAAGLYDGPIDGDPGPMTRDGLRRWRELHPPS